MRVATIDVGSNSVLLLVSEWNGQRWVPISEQSKVTGLGRGTKATGLLAANAISETLGALASAFDAARSFGATQVAAAGTMALRIASNSEEFLRQADAQGTPVIVLSGEDEARLGFQAVATDPVFSLASELAIVDPGGHSTEIVIAEKVQHQPAGAVVASEFWDVQYQKSFPVGALALREREMKEERSFPSDIIEATMTIDRVLQVDHSRPFTGKVACLGATGTNLVTLREKMTLWDPSLVHGQVLSYEEISRAVGWLCDMTDAERASLAGLEPGREKTIHAGSLILERSLYALKAEECFVSTRGWRHSFLEETFSSLI